MGLYNFHRQFVPFIRSGRKRHTIRGDRENPERVGKIMNLYVGLRHPGAKLIFRAPCMKIERIKIYSANLSVDPVEWKSHIVEIDGVVLNNAEKETLAYADGFKSFEEMLRFWKSLKNRLPFEGNILHWNFEKRTRGSV